MSGDGKSVPADVTPSPGVPLTLGMSQQPRWGPAWIPPGFPATAAANGNPLQGVTPTHTEGMAKGRIGKDHDWKGKKPNLTLGHP